MDVQPTGDQPQKKYTGELACLDQTGDTKCMWDKNNSAEVAAAQAQFDSLKKQGFAAYKAVGEKGTKGELIREFDKDLERIIMVPPMAGG